MSKMGNVKFKNILSNLFIQQNVPNVRTFINKEYEQDVICTLSKLGLSTEVLEAIKDKAIEVCTKTTISYETSLYMLYHIVLFNIQMIRSDITEAQIREIDPGQISALYCREKIKQTVATLKNNFEQIEKVKKTLFCSTKKCLLRSKEIKNILSDKRKYKEGS